MRPHPNVLDRDRAALVVIDVQERIDAVMTDRRHTPRIEDLVDAFGTLELPVVATEQYPKGLGDTVASLRERYEGDPIEKDTFSCVREPRFVQAIEAVGREQLVVCGIEAHVCVVQTVLDLLAAGHQVHVPHDAVNSRRVADREWGMRRMVESGAVPTTTESVLFELVERCGTDDFRAMAALVKRLPVES